MSFSSVGRAALSPEVPGTSPELLIIPSLSLEKFDNDRVVGEESTNTQHHVKWT